jgi:hypothetical protein
MSSQQQPEEHIPADTPQRPEIGNFKLFWKNERDLWEQGNGEEACHILSGIVVMCFGTSHSYSVRFQEIGEKIDKLLHSEKEAERNAVETLIEALDIRCSVLSHPWWKGFDDKPDNSIQQILDFTETLFTQLLDDNLLTDSGSIPEHHLESMAKWESFFAQHAGSDWQTRERPSFDDWVIFTRKFDPDVDFDTIGEGFL